MNKIFFLVFALIVGSPVFAQKGYFDFGVVKTFTPEDFGILPAGSETMGDDQMWEKDKQTHLPGVFVRYNRTRWSIQAGYEYQKYRGINVDLNAPQPERSFSSVQNQYFLNAQYFPLKNNRNLYTVLGVNITQTTGHVKGYFFSSGCFGTNTYYYNDYSSKYHDITGKLGLGYQHPIIKRIVLGADLGILTSPSMIAQKQFAPANQGARYIVDPYISVSAGIKLF